MTLIALYGALKTPNFGDVLLARQFMSLFIEKGAEVVFPDIVDSVATELNVIAGSMLSLKKVDAAVFIGGGYLSPPPGNLPKWSLSRYLSIFSKAHFCRLMGIPYAIIGVGAGPTASPFTTPVFRSFCDGSTELIVRDPESAAYLKCIGIQREIKIASDYALSIKPKRQSKLSTYLGIHLSAQLPLINETVVNYLIKNQLLEQAYLIEDHFGELDRITSLQPHITRAFADRIIRYRGNEAFLTTLQMFKFVLTSKLHVGIISARMGLNVCALPYHSKVPNFYRDIERSDLCLYRPSIPVEVENHIQYCLSAPAITVPHKVLDRLKIIETAVEVLAERK